MQQGSFWNRNAAVALILAAAAIISLVYLLSSGTDEAFRGPEGGPGVIGSGGSSGAGTEARPDRDPESTETGTDPAPESGDVELAGPPLLSGVVSGDGAPIDGASIHLVAASYVERILSRVADMGSSAGGIPDFEKIIRVVIDGVDAVRRSAHIAKTDARGLYEFRGIESREYLVLTVADGWIFRYCDVVVLAAGETRELNQELERGATISGRVVDARGQGVGGIPITARVRASGSSGMGLVFARLVEYADGTILRGAFEARTATDGTFSIDSLAPGAYDLEARGPSDLRVGIRNIATGSADALIYLGAPAWVDGIFLDSGGTPLECISIEVKQRDSTPLNPMMAMGFGAMADVVKRGLGRGPRTVETDALGRFRVGPFAPGDYHLSLVDKALRPLQRQFTLSWGQELSLGMVQVDPGGRVLGRVLAEGGDGIEGATVTVTPDDAGFLRMGAVMQDMISGRSRVESGPEGEFELGGLAPGAYWVSVVARGWSPNGVKTEVGEDDCEIRLERGARVTGIVTDARSRDPVRATVTGGQVETETDAEGRFALDGVAYIDWNDPNVSPLMRVRATVMTVPEDPEKAEQRIVTLRVTAEGYSTSEVTLDMARGENEADVRLSPAPDISGRVLSPAGEPVAGSLVRVIVGQQSLPSSFMDPSLLTLRIAISDTEGRYRVKSVREIGPNGWYQLLADHPEYARGESQSFRLEPEQEHEIDLTLMDPAIVKGVVTDGTRSIAGAEVRLKKIDKAERNDQSEMMMRMFGLPRGGTPAYTDGDGRFVYRKVVAGHYVIYVEVPGLGSAPELEIRVEAGREVDLELLVDTGEEIRGMVFDTEGNSLDGALVKLLRDPSADEGGDPNQMRALQKMWGVAFKTTRTDEEGVYVFGGVPDGRYTVQAIATGYVSAEATDVAAGETDIELVLAAGAGLEGRVIDATTGGAVTDFYLFVVKAGQKAEAWAFQNLLESGSGREANHPDGRFSRSDLAAGAYRILVKATGYLPASASVELLEDRVVEQEFALVRGARIRGTVVDRATRRPVVGASVGMKEGPPPSSTEPADEDAPLPEIAKDTRSDTAQAWLEELLRGEKVRTGTGGQFLIESVPAGVVTVAVEHNEYVTETRELPAVGMGEELEIVIPLSRGLVLSGRAVTESGDGVASRYLFLNGGSPETRGISKSAVTSSDGAFRFAGLKPGKYRVNLPPSGGVSQEPPESNEIDLRESVSDYELRVPSP